MDDRRFDALARSLATPKTRRGLLGALAALAAGAIGASAQSCPPGQTANRKGDCSCPPGTDACPDDCFDKKRDLNNCGACGRSCAGGECRKGECRCPGGATPTPQFGCLPPPTTTTTTTTAAPTTTTTAAPTTTTTAAPTTTTTTTTTPPSPFACAAGANVCVQGISEVTLCGPSATCVCYAAANGGTICASGGGCFPCTSDVECAAEFGPGSACIDDAGPWCGCPTGTTVCVRPCSA